MIFRAQLRPVGLSKIPWGVFDKFLQSPARRLGAPLAHQAHTGSLRSIFRQVHAPAENF